MRNIRLIAALAAAAAVFCLFGCGAADTNDAGQPLPPGPAGQENSADPASNDAPADLEDVETVVPDDRFVLHTKEEPPKGGGEDPGKQDHQPPAHEHAWEPVYGTRRVEEVPAWDEEVLVREAWTETVDEYAAVTHLVCADCGAYLDGMSEAERSDHVKDHVMSGGKGGHYTAQFREKTGSKTVEHPAQYRTVHHDAVFRGETVITGWRCSCGAVK